MDDKKIESTVFRGDYSQEEMKVNASYIRNARLAISQYITGDEVKVSFTKNIPKEFECLVRCYGSIGSVNNKPTVEVSLPIKLVNLINKCRRRLLRDTITERLYS